MRSIGKVPYFYFYFYIKDAFPFQMEHNTLITKQSKITLFT